VSPAETLGLGLLLGVRHALDPDHVVAMGTLVGREGRASAAFRAGLSWGVGHTVSVLLFGVAIVLFGLRVSGAIERVVEALLALMMIGLGIVALCRSPCSRGSSAPARPRCSTTCCTTARGCASR
jgi:high-affinity nickel permease